MPAEVEKSPVRQKPVLPTGWLVAGGLLWLGLIAAGMGLMMAYENTAGVSGSTPEEWPRASGLERTPDRATLVMAAHPKCPCTRATIEQLALAMAQSGGRVTAHVLFFRPKGASEDWSRTDLWKAAAAIPGVVVSSDEASREAARFGGETSGGIHLYDAAGRLIFRGGLTAARGQAGESDGLAALSALLAGRTSPLTRTPIFGCALDDSKTTTFAQNP
jgi:hypothetical protein